MTTAILVAIRRTSLAAVALLLAVPAMAVVNTGIDPDAKMPYWEVNEQGVSIRFVQRLPDQTRGFFQARGFTVPDADHIAMSCVFQTIFRNVSPPAAPVTIEYNLREWVVHVGGAKRAMKTREDWQAEWMSRGAPHAAQLAFEWALLPTRQSYRPSDYNWGMTVFNLAPGTRFDLDVVWYRDGVRRSARLAGIECAPDIHPAPGAV